MDTVGIGSRWYVSEEEILVYDKDGSICHIILLFDKERDLNDGYDIRIKDKDVCRKTVSTLSEQYILEHGEYIDTIQDVGQIKHSINAYVHYYARFQERTIELLFKNFFARL